MGPSHKSSDYLSVVASGSSSLILFWSALAKVVGCQSTKQGDLCVKNLLWQPSSEGADGHVQQRLVQRHPLPLSET